MSKVLAPPAVRLSWSATSLTTNFGGYRVYRRPRRSPVVAWSKIAELSVPTTYTAATVEAQHTSFVDYEAGWSVTGAQWVDGWEYAVTVVNALTGVEATISSWVNASPAAADVAWLCSNLAPWVNLPVTDVEQYGTADDQNQVYRAQIAGRDLAVTRSRFETPARSVSLGWRSFAKHGEDPFRAYRAAQALGNPMAFHLPSGDRIIGSLQPLALTHGDVWTVDARGGLTETVRESTGYVVADYNGPAGIVLDGSADYVSVASDTNLNPGSSAFSVVCLAGFANAGSSKYALAKGNLGTSAGYGLRTTGSANQLEWAVTGASTTATATSTSATWFDGQPHVAVGTTSGTSQVLYQDGSSVATGSTTHGSVTNAVALTVGANNGGTAAWSSSRIHAFAVYLRELTATEAQAASYYLLGYPGYRMPYGAVLFHDLRDTRCWDGVRQSSTDLSGYGYSSTFVSSPPTVGFPWRLELTDRF